jgi:hypothetical protein
MVFRLFIAALSVLVICVNTYSAASDDLYLVIGSSRVEGLNLLKSNEITKKLLYSEDIDATHRSTFGGRATTLDLLDSKTPNLPHIVGDASSYDFSNYSIRAVFIERIPTFIEPDQNVEDSNLLGLIINNVARHMVSGATLEIELDPFVDFFLEDIPPDEFIDTVKNNPFNGWYNYRVAYYGLMLSYSNVVLQKSLESEISKIPNISTEKKKAILEAVEQIKLWVTKTSIETELSTKEIYTRLAQEMSIYQELYKKSSEDVTKYVALKHSVYSTNENFSFSFFYRSFLESPDNDKDVSSPKFILYEYPKGSGLEKSKHQLVDIFQFFEGTFSNRLLGILSVERNKRFIIQELERRGFKDITFDFTNNRHNGRRNIWMISAIKI